MLVTVKDGRAIKVGGDPQHPVTQGFLCAKVSRYVERTYHADRLLYPKRRVGPRGSGRWERISWDEALDEIAARFRGIADEHGPEAILPYSYAGTMGLLMYGSMDRRFFNRLGASLLDRTICAEAGATGYRYTVGASMGTDPERFVDARLILLWGTNTLTSNPHLWPFIKRARAQGAHVVAIDPYRSRTARQCDEHLALRPGTDAALALGMLNVIFAEGLEDREYLERYTVGANELRERAAEYPPERVAAITGLEAERIIALARRYATTRPAAIRINYGMQRHAGGGMAVRTVATLPAVVGAWREPAGGILLSTSGTFPLNYAALERPDLLPPGTRTINMNRLGHALTELDDPPVKAIFVYNCNPAAVAPDLERVHQGLMRDDLFVVVHELFPTDTVSVRRYRAAGDDAARARRYPQGVRPPVHVMERAGDRAAGRGAAEHRGVPASGGDDGLSRSLASAIRTRKWRARCLPQPIRACRASRSKRCASTAGCASICPMCGRPLPKAAFRRPAASASCTPSAWPRDGFDPLPVYTPPAESAESDPALAAQYPLALLSPPAHHFLNSSFVNVLRRFEGEPSLEINPHDATARQIVDGELVRVFNDRGEFRVRAAVTDRVRPGLVLAPSIWWRSLTPDGNGVNHTTSQRLSRHGRRRYVLR